MNVTSIQSQLLNVPSFHSLPSVIVDMLDRNSSYKLAQGYKTSVMLGQNPVLWRYPISHWRYATCNGHVLVMLHNNHSLDIYRRRVLPSDCEIIQPIEIESKNRNSDAWEIVASRLLQRIGAIESIIIHKHWIFQVSIGHYDALHSYLLICVYEFSGALKSQFQINIPDVFYRYKIFCVINSSDEIIISYFGDLKEDMKQIASNDFSSVYVWIYTSNGKFVNHFTKNASNLVDDRLKIYSPPQSKPTPSQMLNFKFCKPGTDLHGNFYVLYGMNICKLNNSGDLISIVELHSGRINPLFPQEFNEWSRYALFIAATGEFIITCQHDSMIRNPGVVIYVFKPNGAFEREIDIIEENRVWKVDISNVGHLIVHTYDEVVCYC